MADLNKSGLLIKVKNKNILKKIFAALEEKKSLKIINYNKKIQNKLNRDINDYKEYLRIEIDVFPKTSVSQNIPNNFSVSGIYAAPKADNYGQFINVSKLEPFYHIFFNDNKNEVKKNKISYEDNVTKIKIKVDYEIKSLNGLFTKCKCIQKVCFIKCNRKGIKNMSAMFNGCESLEEVDLSNLNTADVTNMSLMFYQCTALKEIKIKLKNFNTNNVLYMNHMFTRCLSIKELDLSDLKTDNVKDVSNMFNGCNNLTKLKISKLNTSSVTNMSGMFQGCSLLKELDLSDLNTSNVTNMSGMFN